MKKTLLISTAVLLSIASMAQTQVSGHHVSNTKTGIEKSGNGGQTEIAGSASSSATVAPGLQKAKNKTKAEIKKEEKALAAEKNRLSGEVSDKKDEAAVIASKDASISASANSKTSANAGNENNKVSNNTSASTSASVETTPVINQANQNVNNTKAKLKSTGDATVETGTQVITEVTNVTVQSSKKAEATSATTTKAGVSHVQSAQPKPVVIKTAAQVTTNVGIKLR